MDKYQAGCELYVNGKWYWDILSVKGDKLVVQMYYKTGTKGERGLRTATAEISPELINFESEYKPNVYKVNIKVSDIKSLIGGLIHNLAVSPDVYSLINSENVTESSHQTTLINPSTLSAKGKSLLYQLEKAIPDYSLTKWKKFASEIGVPCTCLMEHIFNVYNGKKSNTPKTVAKFEELKNITTVLEDGAAAATAGNVAGMGAVTTTPAPSCVPGVPGNAGSDLAVGGLKKKKKKIVYTKPMANISTKNEARTSFGDLLYNKELNKDIQDNQYALVKIPKENFKHIKLLFSFKDKNVVKDKKNFPKAPDEKAIGNDKLESPKPAAYSEDTQSVLSNLIYHKFSVMSKLLNESVGNEEATYKDRLYKFLDFPWNDESEKEIVNELSANRDKFRIASVGEIKNYLKEYWNNHKEKLEKMNDEFVSDYMVLSDITAAGNTETNNIQQESFLSYEEFIRASNL